MANENFERKKKVSRQSWKLTGVPALLKGLWIGLYSVLKVILGALATVFVIGVICVVVFVGTLGDYLQDDIIPNSNVSLDGFDLNQNSVVYFLNENGDIEILQKLYAETNSQRATYEEIPEAMIAAAVSIEDKRFYEHQGVDWFTTIKACVNMFIGSGDKFGGSSITQQLIKNLFLKQDETADDVTVQRKIQEIFRATELEKRYDKKVILTWYLNEIYLGHQIYGVKAAAEYYFGKELELLTPAECACLISITNNPSIFDPTKDKEVSYNGEVKSCFEHNHTRKENTLWMMRNEGYLTEEEYQEALAQELVFKRGIDKNDRLATCANEACGYRGTVGTYTVTDDVYHCPVCGTVTDIQEDQSQYVYSWFVDTVLEDVCTVFAERDGLNWDELPPKTKDTYKQLVSGGGYHIYSTIDMNVQEYVDKVYTNLDEFPEGVSLQQLQSGIVIIDNTTGDVVAMAGGVGEKVVHDGYNRATDAKLQPGSAIKPLTVYGPAFEQGIITPATVIADMPVTYTGSRPFPYNVDRTYGYTSTIVTGVLHSYNTTSVNVLDSIGTGYSFEFAKNNFRLRYLVEDYWDKNGDYFTDLGRSPLALGAPTIGITVRQMANAYATFPNGGEYRDARTYTKVYNSKGELVIDNQQSSEQILTEKANEYVNYCLDEVVRIGTGYYADFQGVELAAKTGSTTDSKDRWICGYTAHYTAAVWVGYDTPEVVTIVGDGNNPASLLLRRVFQPLHEDLKRVPLYDDSNFEEIEICLDCGKLATDACSVDARTFNTGDSRVEKVKVYTEDIPVESCDCHVIIDFCESCNAVANDYCKKLAGVGYTNIVKRSLAKVTENELDSITRVANKGLLPVHTNSNWIYLVDEDGNPVNFKGIFGNMNRGVKAPYIICTEHSASDWQDYLNGKLPPVTDVPDEPLDTETE